ncbi:MAG: hypothetical protein H6679_00615 [Epsilonproteobacteria bacterium]|nr:hypothetical protein [Campylobacterota bacterium]
MLSSKKAFLKALVVAIATTAACVRPMEAKIEMFGGVVLYTLLQAFFNAAYNGFPNQQMHDSNAKKDKEIFAEHRDKGTVLGMTLLALYGAELQNQGQVLNRFGAGFAFAYAVEFFWHSFTGLASFYVNQNWQKYGDLDHVDRKEQERTRSYVRWMYFYGFVGLMSLYNFYKKI